MPARTGSSRYVDAHGGPVGHLGAARRCGSPPAGRGSASRPTTGRSRTRSAGWRPPCTWTRAATAARRPSRGCTTSGRPPRRLVLLHLDGSDSQLPAHGDPVELEGRQVGFVTTSARHYELGPIALALVKRNVAADAALVAGGVAAAQEAARPGRLRSGLQQQGHRPVVDQGHLHVGAEPSGLDLRPARRAACATRCSTSGSATGPGAAACHVGRRPLRASPYSVNWLTTSSGAPRPAPTARRAGCAARGSSRPAARRRPRCRHG